MAHHQFGKFSRTSWDWAESLVHDRRRSTINNHPCSAKSHLSQEKLKQLSVCCGSTSPWEPPAKCCVIPGFLWACAHIIRAALTQTSKLPLISQIHCMHRKPEYSRFKNLYNSTVKRVKIKTWWIRYGWKHKFTLGICCRKEATLQQPGIVLTTMTFCEVINIPKTKTRYRHRHPKTAALKARTNNNLIPTGQHKKLLPGTVLSAGRGQRWSTSPSHLAEHM